VLYNMPLASEDHVEFATDAIRYLREHDLDVMEPTQEAETQWGALVDSIAQKTLLPGMDSWYTGANIPGKPRVCMIYLGGAPSYRKICSDVEANGYIGFALDRTAAIAA
jgi:cyclohexanone monooxygenase